MGDSHCHDHTHRSEADIAAALDHARAVCASRDGRLTPLREQVLSLLLRGTGPAKAYDLLGQLGDAGAAKPPTVYRALEFLMQMGLVHRIESLNAFVACTGHGQSGAGLFLICTCCGGVEEQAGGDLTSWLTQEAARSGFRLEQTVIEARGLCAACVEGAP
jgi:Fur family zinc uptake transcriptional regulator